MDGAKLVTDTVGILTKIVVNRCSEREEAFLQGNVDLLEIKILVVVRSKRCENHRH